MAGPAVADAGPLHYLILIDCADVLARLFDRVLVPPAVRNELLHLRTPEKVKDWLLQAPPWFEVVRVSESHPIRGLHRGETQALELTIQTNAAAVLLDDLDARTAARRLGIPIIGTIAVLERAAEKDLLDLPEVISRLRRTNFFVPTELFEAALKRDRDRRK